MLNLFLAAMDDKCQAGDISSRHFADYQQSCKVVVDHFGRNVKVATLRAADFAALRKSFPETWGPTKLGTEIQRIRTAFRWAAESEVIALLPNFGPDFKKPPKRVVRIAKQARQAEHGTLDFTAEEVQSLIRASDGYLRACILLGVNSGFGNADCGRLRTNNIDFDAGWYDLARRQTGIPRRFYVWQETRDAIRAAMAQRPIPQDDNDEHLCLLTSHGTPVWWETDTGSKCDNVGKAFLKLCRSRDRYRPGRNFYSLRRTLETIAGATKDQVAVDYVMEHSDACRVSIRPELGGG